MHRVRRAHVGMQFNMDVDVNKPINSMIARQASICDLIKAGKVRGQIVRGSLILKDGSVKLFTLKVLLRALGCTFDAAIRAWRRGSVSTAERYAIGSSTPAPLF